MRSGLIILLTPCLGRLGSGWALVPTGCWQPHTSPLYTLHAAAVHGQDPFCVDASRVLC